MPFNPDKAKAYIEGTRDDADANLASVFDVTPDAAVRGLNDERKYGIPASIGMREKGTVINPSAGAVRNAHVDRFVASSPARAAAVADDQEPLGQVSDFLVKLNQYNPVIQATRNFARPAIESFQVLRQAKEALDRTPQGTDAHNEALKTYDEAASALSWSPLTGAANIFSKPISDVLGHVPFLRKPGETPEQASEGINPGVNLAVSFFIPGLRSKRPAAQRFEPPPSEPPPIHPDSGGLPPAPESGGRYTVDEHGFVVDAEGKPTRFETAKDAALWARANRGQDDRVFQHDLHPRTKEVGVRVIEPEVRFSEEGPGVSPETDSNLARQAEQVNKELEQLEEVVVNTQTFSRSPDLMEEFMEGVAPGQTVKLDPQTVLNLSQTDHDFFMWALSEESGEFTALLKKASASGAYMEMPLSQYMKWTAGKPWSAELRKGVTVGDGITIEQAKEFRPKIEPEEPDNPIVPLGDWTYAGAKTLGSNPGGFYTDKGGAEWLVKGDQGAFNKSPLELERRARNEVLAAALMNEAIPGHAPEMKLVDLGEVYGGGVGVASKIIPDLEPFNPDDPVQRKLAAETFALHAWLGNWDVVGMDFDNMMFDPVKKQLIHIDPGGALLYRAMGSPKKEFPNHVGELETMRDPNISPTAAYVFEHMTEEELKASASVLNKFSDKKLMQITADYGLPELGSTLIWRKQDILEKTGAEAIDLQAAAKELDEGIEDPEGAAPTKFDMEDELALAKEQGWDFSGDYWQQQTGKEFPEPEDLEEPEWDQFDDFTKAQVLQAKAASKAAAKRVVKEQFLGKLFKDAKAAGMSETQFRLYSEQVEKAFNNLYDKLWKRTYAKIKTQYTKEWQQTYNKYFPTVTNEVLDRPVMRVEHALRFSITDYVDLVKDNSFVENGEPITFYHASTHADIGEPNNPWKTVHHDVISFSSDPKWAIKYKSLTHTTESIMEGYGPAHAKPTVYIVHLKAKNAADFRKPEDVKKAARWLFEEASKHWSEQTWKNEAYKYGLKYEGANTKELVMQEEIKHLESQLKGGNWNLWEKPKMWHDLGWDAAYMKESEYDPTLNACVEKGSQIYFKYQDRKEELNFKLAISEQANYPASLWKDLPKTMWSKSGQSADEIAKEFGFASGFDMLRSLREMEIDRGDVPFRKYVTDTIKGITRELALKDVGDILNPDRIYTDASEVFVAPEITDLLIEELQALAAKIPASAQQGFVFDKATIQTHALDDFATMQVKKAMNIREFEKQMGRAGRRAEVALLKGKVIEAFKAKQDQLITHYQLIEAHNLSRNYARITKKINRWAKNKSLSNMSQEYLDRIHQLLLNHVGIKRDAAELARGLNNVTFESWWQSKLDEGQDIFWAPVAPLPLEDLLVHDFRNLDATLTSIAKYARTEKNVLLNGKAQKLEDVMNVIEREAAGLPDKPINRNVGGFKTGKQSLSQHINRVHMEQRVLEDLFEEMGGTLGTVTRILQHGADDAANLEDSMKQTYYKPMLEAYGKIPKELRSTYKMEMNEKILIDPRDGGLLQVRRQHLLSIALNLGNAGNAEKLAKGYGTTIEELTDFVNKYITPEEISFIKVVGNIFKDLFPIIDKNARAMRGYGIREVKPDPIELGGEKLEGWYYPIHYDPMLAIKPVKKANPDLTQRPFRVLTTESGFEQDRVEGVEGAIDLNLDRVLRKHLRNVFVRVAYGQYIQSARTLIQDQRFKTLVEKKLGKEAYDLMIPWLESQVYDIGAPPMDLKGSTNLVAWWRRNMSATFMGGSSSVTKSQVLGLLPTAAKIGPDWTLHGIKRFMIAMSKGELNKEIYDKSEMMKFRHLNIDYNVGEARDQIHAMDLEKHGLPQVYGKVRDVGFKLINLADKYTVTGFTWLGAYDKAKAVMRMSEGDAIRYADQIVRQTQGTGQMKDLPAVQRQGEFTRLWTWAATWPLRYYNLLTSSVNDINRGRKGGWNKLLWLAVILPLVTRYFQGDTPEDQTEWEDWLWWGVRGIAFGPTSASVWTRDVGNFAERRVAGKYAGQGGPQTPLARAAEAGWSTFQGRDLAKNGITFLGLIGIIPTGAAQIGKTSQFLSDVVSGEVDPEGFDWVEGLLTGQVKED